MSATSASSNLSQLREEFRKHSSDFVAPPFKNAATFLISEPLKKLVAGLNNSEVSTRISDLTEAVSNVTEVLSLPPTTLERIRSLFGRVNEALASTTEVAEESPAKPHPNDIPILVRLQTLMKENRLEEAHAAATNIRKPLIRNSWLKLISEKMHAPTSLPEADLSKKGPLDEDVTAVEINEDILTIIKGRLDNKDKRDMIAGVTGKNVDAVLQKAIHLFLSQNAIASADTAATLLDNPAKKQAAAEQIDKARSARAKLLSVSTSSEDTTLKEFCNYLEQMTMPSVEASVARTFLIGIQPDLVDDHSLDNRLCAAAFYFRDNYKMASALKACLLILNPTKRTSCQEQLDKAMSASTGTSPAKKSPTITASISSSTALPSGVDPCTHSQIMTLINEKKWDEADFLIKKLPVEKRSAYFAHFPRAVMIALLLNNPH